MASCPSFFAAKTSPDNLCLESLLSSVFRNVQLFCTMSQRYFFHMILAAIFSLHPHRSIAYNAHANGVEGNEANSSCESICIDIFTKNIQLLRGEDRLDIAILPLCWFMEAADGRLKGHFTELVETHIEGIIRESPMSPVFSAGLQRLCLAANALLPRVQGLLITRIEDGLRIKPGQLQQRHPSARHAPGGGRGHFSSQGLFVAWSESAASIETKLNCFRVLQHLRVQWERSSEIFTTVCLPYFAHPSRLLRMECVWSCLKVVFSSGRPSPRVTGILAFHLVSTALTDVSEEIRFAALNALRDERISRDLYHNTNAIDTLFSIINDESPRVSNLAICMLRDISELNPSATLPRLRKVLLQQLSEVQNAATNDDSSRLITDVLLERVLNVMESAPVAAAFYLRFVTTVLRKILLHMDSIALAAAAVAMRMITFAFNLASEAEWAQFGPFTEIILAFLVRAEGELTRFPERFPQFKHFLLPALEALSYVTQASCTSGSSEPFFDRIIPVLHRLLLRRSSSASDRDLTVAVMRMIGTISALDPYQPDLLALHADNTSTLINSSTASLFREVLTGAESGAGTDVGGYSIGAGAGSAFYAPPTQMSLAKITPQKSVFNPRVEDSALSHEVLHILLQKLNTGHASTEVYSAAFEALGVALCVPELRQSKSAYFPAIAAVVSTAMNRSFTLREKAFSFLVKVAPKVLDQPHPRESGVLFALCKRHWNPNEPIIITRIMRLVYALNTGAAHSSGLHEQRAWLITNILNVVTQYCTVPDLREATLECLTTLKSFYANKHTHAQSDALLFVVIPSLCSMVIISATTTVRCAAIQLLIHIVPRLTQEQLDGYVPRIIDTCISLFSSTLEYRKKALAVIATAEGVEASNERVLSRSAAVSQQKAGFTRKEWSDLQQIATINYKAQTGGGGFFSRLFAKEKPPTPAADSPEALRHSIMLERHNVYRHRHKLEIKEIVQEHRDAKAFVASSQLVALGLPIAVAARTTWVSAFEADVLALICVVARATCRDQHVDYLSMMMRSGTLSTTSMTTRDHAMLKTNGVFDSFYVAVLTSVKTRFCHTKDNPFGPAWLARLISFRAANIAAITGEPCALLQAFEASISAPTTKGMGEEHSTTVTPLHSASNTSTPRKSSTAKESGSDEKKKPKSLLSTPDKKRDEKFTKGGAVESADPLAAVLSQSEGQVQQQLRNEARRLAFIEQTPVVLRFTQLEFTMSILDLVTKCKTRMTDFYNSEGSSRAAPRRGPGVGEQSTAGGIVTDFDLGDMVIIDKISGGKRANPTTATTSGPDRTNSSAAATTSTGGAGKGANLFTRVLEFTGSVGSNATRKKDDPTAAEGDPRHVDGGVRFVSQPIHQKTNISNSISERASSPTASVSNRSRTRKELIEALAAKARRSVPMPIPLARGQVRRASFSQKTEVVEQQQQRIYDSNASSQQNVQNRRNKQPSRKLSMVCISSEPAKAKHTQKRIRRGHTVNDVSRSLNPHLHNQRRVQSASSSALVSASASASASALDYLKAGGGGGGEGVENASLAPCEAYMYLTRPSHLTVAGGGVGPYANASFGVVSDATPIANNTPLRPRALSSSLQLRHQHANTNAERKDKATTSNSPSLSGAVSTSTNATSHLPPLPNNSHVLSSAHTNAAVAGGAVSGDSFFSGGVSVGNSFAMVSAAANAKTVTATAKANNGDPQGRHGSFAARSFSASAAAGGGPPQKYNGVGIGRPPMQRYPSVTIVNSLLPATSFTGSGVPTALPPSAAIRGSIAGHHFSAGLNREVGDWLVDAEKSLKVWQQASSAGFGVAIRTVPAPTGASGRPTTMIIPLPSHEATATNGFDGGLFSMSLSSSALMPATAGAGAGFKSEEEWQRWFAALALPLIRSSPVTSIRACYHLAEMDYGVLCSLFPGAQLAMVCQLKQSADVIPRARTILTEWCEEFEKFGILASARLEANHSAAGAHRSGLLGGVLVAGLSPSALAEHGVPGPSASSSHNPTPKLSSYRSSGKRAPAAENAGMGAAVPTPYSSPQLPNGSGGSTTLPQFPAYSSFGNGGTTLQGGAEALAPYLSLAGGGGAATAGEGTANPAASSPALGLGAANPNTATASTTTCPNPAGTAALLPPLLPHQSHHLPYDIMSEIARAAHYIHCNSATLGTAVSCVNKSVVATLARGALLVPLAVYYLEQLVVEGDTHHAPLLYDAYRQALLSDDSKGLGSILDTIHMGTHKNESIGPEWLEGVGRTEEAISLYVKQLVNERNTNVRRIADTTAAAVSAKRMLLYRGARENEAGSASDKLRAILPIKRVTSENSFRQRNDATTSQPSSPTGAGGMPMPSSSALASQRPPLLPTRTSASALRSPAISAKHPSLLSSVGGPSAPLYRLPSAGLVHGGGGLAFDSLDDKAVGAASAELDNSTRSQNQSQPDDRGATFTNGEMNAEGGQPIAGLGPMLASLPSSPVASRVASDARKGATDAGQRAASPKKEAANAPVPPALVSHTTSSTGNASGPSPRGPNTPTSPTEAMLMGHSLSLVSGHNIIVGEAEELAEEERGRGNGGAGVITENRRVNLMESTANAGRQQQPSDHLQRSERSPTSAQSPSMSFAPQFLPAMADVLPPSTRTSPTTQFVVAGHTSAGNAARRGGHKQSLSNAPVVVDAKPIESNDVVITDKTNLSTVLGLARCYNAMMDYASVLKIYRLTRIHDGDAAGSIADGVSSLLLEDETNSRAHRFDPSSPHQQSNTTQHPPLSYDASGGAFLISSSSASGPAAGGMLHPTTTVAATNTNANGDLYVSSLGIPPPSSVDTPPLSAGRGDISQQHSPVLGGRSDLTGESAGVGAQTSAQMTPMETINLINMHHRDHPPISEGNSPNRPNGADAFCSSEGNRGEAHSAANSPPQLVRVSSQIRMARPSPSAASRSALAGNVGPIAFSELEEGSQRGNNTNGKGGGGQRHASPTHQHQRLLSGTSSPGPQRSRGNSPALFPKGGTSASVSASLLAAHTTKQHAKGITSASPSASLRGTVLEPALSAQAVIAAVALAQWDDVRDICKTTLLPGIRGFGIGRRSAIKQVLTEEGSKVRAPSAASAASPSVARGGSAPPPTGEGALDVTNSGGATKTNNASTVAAGRTARRRGVSMAVVHPYNRPSPPHQRQRSSLVSEESHDHQTQRSNNRDDEEGDYRGENESIHSSVNLRLRQEYDDDYGIDEVVDDDAEVIGEDGEVMTYGAYAERRDNALLLAVLSAACGGAGSSGGQLFDQLLAGRGTAAGKWGLQNALQTALRLSNTDRLSMLFGTAASYIGAGDFGLSSRLLQVINDQLLNKMVLFRAQSDYHRLRLNAMFQRLFELSEGLQFLQTEQKSSLRVGAIGQRILPPQAQHSDLVSWIAYRSVMLPIHRQLVNVVALTNRMVRDGLSERAIVGISALSHYHPEVPTLLTEEYRTMVGSLYDAESLQVIGNGLGEAIGFTCDLINVLTAEEDIPFDDAKSTVVDGVTEDLMGGYPALHPGVMQKIMSIVNGRPVPTCAVGMSDSVTINLHANTSSSSTSEQTGGPSSTTHAKPSGAAAAAARVIIPQSTALPSQTNLAPNGFDRAIARNVAGLVRAELTLLKLSASRKAESVLASRSLRLQMSSSLAARRRLYDDLVVAKTVAGVRVRTLPPLSSSEAVVERYRMAEGAVETYLHSPPLFTELAMSLFDILEYLEDELKHEDDHAEEEHGDAGERIETDSSVATNEGKRSEAASSKTPPIDSVDSSSETKADDDKTTKRKKKEKPRIELAQYDEDGVLLDDEDIARCKRNESLKDMATQVVGALSKVIHFGTANYLSHPYFISSSPVTAGSDGGTPSTTASGLYGADFGVGISVEAFSMASNPLASLRLRDEAQKDSLFLQYIRDFSGDRRVVSAQRMSQLTHALLKMVHVSVSILGSYKVIDLSNAPVHLWCALGPVWVNMGANDPKVLERLRLMSTQSIPFLRHMAYHLVSYFDKQPRSAEMAARQALQRQTESKAAYHEQQHVSPTTKGRAAGDADLELDDLNDVSQRRSPAARGHRAKSSDTANDVNAAPFEEEIETDGEAEGEEDSAAATRTLTTNPRGTIYHQQKYSAKNSDTVRSATCSTTNGSNSAREKGRGGGDGDADSATLISTQGTQGSDSNANSQYHQHQHELPTAATSSSARRGSRDHDLHNAFLGSSSSVSVTLTSVNTTNNASSVLIPQGTMKLINVHNKSLPVPLSPSSTKTNASDDLSPATTNGRNSLVESAPRHNGRTPFSCSSAQQKGNRGRGGIGGGPSSFLSGAFAVTGDQQFASSLPLASPPRSLTAPSRGAGLLRQSLTTDPLQIDSSPNMSSPRRASSAVALGIANTNNNSAGTFSGFGSNANNSGRENKHEKDFLRPPIPTSRSLASLGTPPSDSLTPMNSIVNRGRAASRSSPQDHNLHPQVTRAASSTAADRGNSGNSNSNDNSNNRPTAANCRTVIEQRTTPVDMCQPASPHPTAPHAHRSSGGSASPYAFSSLSTRGAAVPSQQQQHQSGHPHPATLTNLNLSSLGLADPSEALALATGRGVRLDASRSVRGGGEADDDDDDENDFVNVSDSEEEEQRVLGGEPIRRTKKGDLSSRQGNNAVLLGSKGGRGASATPDVCALTSPSAIRRGSDLVFGPNATGHTSVTHNGIHTSTTANSGPNTFINGGEHHQSIAATPHHFPQTMSNSSLVGVSFAPTPHSLALSSRQRNGGIAFELSAAAFADTMEASIAVNSARSRSRQPLVATNAAETSPAANGLLPEGICMPALTGPQRPAVVVPANLSAQPAVASSSAARRTRSHTFTYGYGGASPLSMARRSAASPSSPALAADNNAATTSPSHGNGAPPLSSPPIRAAQSITVEFENKTSREHEERSKGARPPPPAQLFTHVEPPPRLLHKFLASVAQVSKAHRHIIQDVMTFGRFVHSSTGLSVTLKGSRCPAPQPLSQLSVAVASGAVDWVYNSKHGGGNVSAEAGGGGEDLGVETHPRTSGVAGREGAVSSEKLGDGKKANGADRNGHRIRKGHQHQDNHQPSLTYGLPNVIQITRRSVAGGAVASETISSPSPTSFEQRSSKSHCHFHFSSLLSSSTSSLSSPPTMQTQGGSAPSIGPSGPTASVCLAEEQLIRLLLSDGSTLSFVRNVRHGETSSGGDLPALLPYEYQLVEAEEADRLEGEHDAREHFLMSPSLSQRQSTVNESPRKRAAVPSAVRIEATVNAAATVGSSYLSSLARDVPKSLNVEVDECVEQRQSEVNATIEDRVIGSSEETKKKADKQSPRIKGQKREARLKKEVCRDSSSLLRAEGDDIPRKAIRARRRAERNNVKAKAVEALIEALFSGEGAMNFVGFTPSLATAPRAEEEEEEMDAGGEDHRGGGGSVHPSGSLLSNCGSAALDDESRQSQVDRQSSAQLCSAGTPLQQVSHAPHKTSSSSILFATPTPPRNHSSNNVVNTNSNNNRNPSPTSNVGAAHETSSASGRVRYTTSGASATSQSSSARQCSNRHGKCYTPPPPRGASHAHGSTSPSHHHLHSIVCGSPQSNTLKAANAVLSSPPRGFHVGGAVAGSTAAAADVSVIFGSSAGDVTRLLSSTSGSGGGARTPLPSVNEKVDAAEEVPPNNDTTAGESPHATNKYYSNSAPPLTIRLLGNEEDINDSAPLRTALSSLVCESRDLRRRLAGVSALREALFNVLLQSVPLTYTRRALRVPVSKTVVLSQCHVAPIRRGVISAVGGSGGAGVGNSFFSGASSTSSSSSSVVNSVLVPASLYHIIAAHEEATQAATRGGLLSACASLSQTLFINRIALQLLKVKRDSAIKTKATLTTCTSVHGQTAPRTTDATSVYPNGSDSITPARRPNALSGEGNSVTVARPAYNNTPNSAAFVARVPSCESLIMATSVGADGKRFTIATAHGSPTQTFDTVPVLSCPPSPGTGPLSPHRSRPHSPFGVRERRSAIPPTSPKSLVMVNISANNNGSAWDDDDGVSPFGLACGGQTVATNAHTAPGTANSSAPLFEIHRGKEVTSSPSQTTGSTTTAGGGGRGGAFESSLVNNNHTGAYFANSEASNNALEATNNNDPNNNGVVVSSASDPNYAGDNSSPEGNSSGGRAGVMDGKPNAVAGSPSSDALRAPLAHQSSSRFTQNPHVHHRQQSAGFSSPPHQDGDNPLPPALSDCTVICLQQHPTEWRSGFDTYAAKVASYLAQYARRVSNHTERLTEVDGLREAAMRGELHGQANARREGKSVPSLSTATGRAGSQASGVPSSRRYDSLVGGRRAGRAGVGLGSGMHVRPPIDGDTDAGSYYSAPPRSTPPLGNVTRPRARPRSANPVTPPSAFSVSSPGLVAYRYPSATKLFADDERDSSTARNTRMSAGIAGEEKQTNLLGVGGIGGPYMYSGSAVSATPPALCYDSIGSHCSHPNGQLSRSAALSRVGEYDPTLRLLSRRTIYFHQRRQHSDVPNGAGGAYSSSRANRSSFAPPSTTSNKKNNKSGKRRSSSSSDYCESIGSGVSAMTNQSHQAQYPPQQRLDRYAYDNTTSTAMMNENDEGGYYIPEIRVADEVTHQKPPLLPGGVNPQMSFGYGNGECSYDELDFGPGGEIIEGIVAITDEETTSTSDDVGDGKAVGTPKKENSPPPNRASAHHISANEQRGNNVTGEIEDEMAMMMRTTTRAPLERDEQRKRKKRSSKRKAASKTVYRCDGENDGADHEGDASAEVESDSPVGGDVLSCERGAASSTRSGSTDNNTNIINAHRADVDSSSSRGMRPSPSAAALFFKHVQSEVGLDDLEATLKEARASSAGAESYSLPPRREATNERPPSLVRLDQDDAGHRSKEGDGEENEGDSSDKNSDNPLSSYINSSNTVPITRQIQEVILSYQQLAMKERMAAIEQARTMTNATNALHDRMLSDAVSMSGWLSARTNYSQQLAEWSALQYLFDLDIGSRDPSRILVDTATGAVAHMDFGAFAMLPAPNTAMCFAPYFKKCLREKKQFELAAEELWSRTNANRQQNANRGQTGENEYNSDTEDDKKRRKSNNTCSGYIVEDETMSRASTKAAASSSLPSQSSPPASSSYAPQELRGEEVDDNEQAATVLPIPTELDVLRHEQQPSAGEQPALRRPPTSESRRIFGENDDDEEDRDYNYKNEGTGEERKSAENSLNPVSRPAKEDNDGNDNDDVLAATVTPTLSVIAAAAAAALEVNGKKHESNKRKEMNRQIALHNGKSKAPFPRFQQQLLVGYKLVTALRAVLMPTPPVTFAGVERSAVPFRLTTALTNALPLKSPFGSFTTFASDLLMNVWSSAADLEGICTYGLAPMCARVRLPIGAPKKLVQQQQPSKNGPTMSVPPLALSVSPLHAVKGFKSARAFSMSHQASLSSSPTNTLNACLDLVSTVRVGVIADARGDLLSDVAGADRKQKEAEAGFSYSFVNDSRKSAEDAIRVFSLAAQMHSIPANLKFFEVTSFLTRLRSPLPLEQRGNLPFTFVTEPPAPPPSGGLKSKMALRKGVGPTVPRSSSPTVATTTIGNSVVIVSGGGACRLNSPAASITEGLRPPPQGAYRLDSSSSFYRQQSNSSPPLFRDTIATAAHTNSASALSGAPTAFGGGGGAGPLSASASASDVGNGNHQRHSPASPLEASAQELINLTRSEGERLYDTKREVVEAIHKGISSPSVIHQPHHASGGRRASSTSRGEGTASNSAAVVRAASSSLRTATHTNTATTTAGTTNTSKSSNLIVVGGRGCNHSMPETPSSDGSAAAAIAAAAFADACQQFKSGRQQQHQLGGGGPAPNSTIASAVTARQGYVNKTASSGSSTAFSRSYSIPHDIHYSSVGNACFVAAVASAAAVANGEQLNVKTLNEGAGHKKGRFEYEEDYPIVGDRLRPFPAIAALGANPHTHDAVVENLSEYDDSDSSSFAVLDDERKGKDSALMSGGPPAPATVQQLVRLLTEAAVNPYCLAMADWGPEPSRGCEGGWWSNWAPHW